MGNTRKPKRRLAPRGLGVRPWLDDLREMTRLCEQSGALTVTSLARDLIHEALRTRRARETLHPASSQAVTGEAARNMDAALAALQQQLTALTQLTQALYAMAPQTLGYAVLIESETRRALEEHLSAAGHGPEAITVLARQLAARSHAETQRILQTLLGAGQMNG